MRSDLTALYYISNFTQHDCQNLPSKSCANRRNITEHFILQESAIESCLLSTERESRQTRHSTNSFVTEWRNVLSANYSHT